MLRTSRELSGVRQELRCLFICVVLFFFLFPLFGAGRATKSVFVKASVFAKWATPMCDCAVQQCTASCDS